MSTGKNTPLSNTYPVAQRDTEAVYGHTGMAPNNITPGVNVESEFPVGTPGGSKTWNEDSSYPVSAPDTSGINGPDYQTRPVETDTITLVDTTIYSNGGTPFSSPVYRAGDSLAGVPATVADTSRTGMGAYGSTASPNLLPESYVAKQVDSMFYGSPADGGPQPGVAVAAKMATPTAVTGPRYITVSWAAAADPSGDKVLGYMVKGYPGGTYWAGRGTTSLQADDVDPDRPYQFAVTAITREGTSPMSDLSTAVQAYNPDEADKLKTPGIAPENLVNPIYTPQGGQVATGPTAAFTDSAALLVLSVNGSTSHAASGTIASYAWDFGDTGTGTGATTTHTYAAAGTFTVKLTVTDSQGKTASVTHSVTVA